MMFKKTLAILLCGVMAGTGCASAGGPRMAQTPAPVLDRAVLADYVGRLPAGSKVKVEEAGGGVLRGTLMKATDEAIVVQRATRIPEPPVTVPLSDIARISLDTRTGHSPALGIFAGIGVAFSALFVIGMIMTAGE
jgi:hypothetical protein